MINPKESPLFVGLNTKGGILGHNQISGSLLLHRKVVDLPHSQGEIGRH
jgi:hypothetical protein